MIYKEKNKQLVFDQNQAKGFKIAETHLNEIVKLELEKGGTIPEHTLPIHVTFYVINGEGVASINGVSSICRQGDVVEVAKNDQRGWRNESESLLELLVLKTKT